MIIAGFTSRAGEVGGFVWPEKWKRVKKEKKRETRGTVLGPEDSPRRKGEAGMGGR